MKYFIIVLMLSGCASQEMAQRHWAWLTQNKAITPGYSTGVNISNISVNGQTYQVISPLR